jgi:hypothetical protein
MVKLGILAVATAVALLACGGGPRTPAFSLAVSSTVAPMTSPSGSVTTTTPTASSPSMNGAGVAVRLPNGWRDASATISGSVSSYATSLGVDLSTSSSLVIAVGPIVDGFARNFNVRSTTYVGDVTVLERDFETFRLSLMGSVLKATHVSNPERITLAGETAEEWTEDAAPAGLAHYALIQIMVSHGDKTYVASLAYAPTDKGATRELQPLLAGWSWT